MRASCPRQTVAIPAGAKLSRKGTEMGQGFGLLMLIAVTLGTALIMRGLRRAEVHPGEVGLLYRSGMFAQEFAPGPLRWFDPLDRSRFTRISVLPRSLHPRDLTVMSHDQFSFRITLAAILKIENARELHEATPQISYPAGRGTETLPGDPFERFATLLAEAALTRVATLTLEEFLADPAGALGGMTDPLTGALPGARLDHLALTQITLPPEVRKMFTEVERVRREGLHACKGSRRTGRAARAGKCRPESGGQSSTGTITNGSRHGEQ